MTKMIDLNPGNPHLRTIHIILGILPLVAGGLYFYIAFVLAFFKLPPEEVRRRPSRAVVSLPMLAIMVTYVFEAIMLFYLPYPRKGTAFADHFMSYVGAAFSWLVFLLDYNWRACKSQTPFPLIPLAAGSVIYLVAESLLFGLCSRSSTQVAVVNAVRIFRLVILVIFSGIVIIYSAIPIPRKRGDEEEPLLGGNTGCYQVDGALPCYGSITQNQQPESQNEADKINPAWFFDRIGLLFPLFWTTNPLLPRIAICVFLIIDRFLFAFVPFLMGSTVDVTLYKGGIFTREDCAVLIVSCFLGLSGVLSVAQRYLWMNIENDCYLRVSTITFGKAMTLVGEVDGSRSSADLGQAVSRGQSIRYAYRSILFDIIPAGLDVFMGVVLLYDGYGPYLALTFAVLVTISLWSSSTTHRRLQDMRKRFMADKDEEQSILRDATSNWQNAVNFDRISYERARYSLAVVEHIDSYSRFFRWRCFDSILQSTVIIPGIVGAFVLGAFQVRWGVMSTGCFVMLLIYLSRLSLRLQQFGKGIRDLTFDLARIDELCRFLGRLPNVSDQEGSTALTFEGGAVGFSDVHFAYSGQKKTLKGVSFQVPAGQMVALVGATGSGKSTVLSLLSRFHDPVQGNITVDGQDIRHATLESLRANIGIVPQDPVVFHDTVMNNVIYGNFSATEEQVVDACKTAAIHEKFASLADGYQTMLGDGKVKLSGGELQRMAIARAVINDPKILLLDEATSSVDSSTEFLVQKSLRKLREGKTTFVVAQRLATVSKADKILVLRHGRVVEQGSHSSLLKENGFYYRLWSRQVKKKHPVQDTNRQKGQPERGQSRLQDTGDLIDMDDSQSAAGIGPVLQVSKLRRTRPHKATILHDIEDPRDDIFDEREAHSTGVDYILKRSTLKPDAPEFIPTSQRVDITGHQTKSRMKHSVKEENIPGVLNKVTEKDHAKNDKHPKHRSGSRRLPSILQQASNGVILANPKRARRRRKGAKRQPILRRERTESEPIGIGLMTER